MSDDGTPQEDAAPREEPTTEAADLPAQIIEEELTRLRQAIEEKTREAQAAQDRYLRALAELDNTRKRSQREREEYIRFANESLLRELLPVLDNFDRAIQAARARGEAPALVAGVELIQRELLRVLEKFGVTAFSSVGQPFNPERHEAVARVVAADHPEMTVVEETLRGYLLNGRVLRPAMVTVSVPPDELSARDG
ncbi:MAG: nucleotide exchange factor GrpE [Candidatus Rokubacteria bacterium]|nr:nucleotide exchange factor GrpE [Candidatus Rokubacteria bacterium]